MQTTLAKALKIKNRLVGDLNRVNEIIVRENSRLSTSNSTVDVAKMIKEAEDIRKKIITVKSALSIATAPISPKLVAMQEFKSLMAWYDTVPTRNGIVENYHTNEKHEYVAHLKQEDIDTLKKELQEKINALQDEIDEFNALTKVELAI